MHFKKQITGATAFKDMWCSWARYEKLWQHKSLEDLHLCERSWVRSNSKWEELPEANSLSSACLALGSLLKQLWEWDAVYLGYFPEKCAEWGMVINATGNSQQCSLLSWTRGCGCTFPRPTDAPVKPNCCPHDRPDRRRASPGARGSPLCTPSASACSELAPEYTWPQSLGFESELLMTGQIFFSPFQPRVCPKWLDKMNKCYELKSISPCSAAVRTASSLLCHFNSL